jgi:hypothetical protein
MPDHGIFAQNFLNTRFEVLDLLTKDNDSESERPHVLFTFSDSLFAAWLFDSGEDAYKYPELIVFWDLLFMLVSEELSEHGYYLDRSGLVYFFNNTKEKIDEEATVQFILMLIGSAMEKAKDQVLLNYSYMYGG